MPGTIHVSVLDFKDLPSSTSSSSILVKVSLGKKEYQTWDKGDFSLPLTTLHGNVVITLQDTEGNNISHKGVQTMSIVEKGLWDDFIPLEGGGNVHLKLQFVLSEEERSRIRSMRESALKKKQLKSSLSLGTASAAWRVVTTSFSANHEVSDSPNSVTHNEAVNMEDLTINAGTSPATSKEESALSWKQITSNDTDGSGETSFAASISKKMDEPLGDMYHSKSIEKIETKLGHVNVLKRPTFLQEASSTTKKNLVTIEQKNDHADQMMKQDPLESTPSNVRKMIGALESSQTKDTRPNIKPPPTKPQTKMVGPEVPKALNSKEIMKPSKMISGRLKNPFLIEELQNIQTHEMKRVEQIDVHKNISWEKSSQEAGKLKELNTIQIQATETKSLEKYEKRKPREDFVRASAVNQSHNLLVNHQDSISTAFVERQGSGINLSNSHEANVQGPLEDKQDKLQSAVFHENEHSSSENSNAWIFPDHIRRLCVTTGTKQVVDLVGGCGIQDSNQEGKKSLSLPEKVERRSMQLEILTKVKKSDRTSLELRRSKPESSAEAETSTGPVGQVIKVAIMVAFGALVLFTRQRKPR